MTPSEFQPIKRILYGVSYNTDTSTLLKSRSTAGDQARSTPYGPAPMPEVEQLFRNRSGKFFFVHRGVPIFDVASGSFLPRDEVHPVTHEDAGRWMERHFPCDPETFLLNFKTAATKVLDEVSATMSLRLDPYWKSALKHEADTRGLSVNALSIAYMRYGLDHSVGYPVLSAEAFTTADKTKLLTADGKPGLNGIEDDGNHQDLTRANLARDLWAEGKLIPENIRRALMFVLSPETPDRELLMADLFRWLKLYDRQGANLDEARMKDFTPTSFVNT